MMPTASIACVAGYALAQTKRVVCKTTKPEKGGAVPNVLDYLREYGDTDLRELPFNEVDNLALCQVSYLDLTGVVPGLGKGDVCVREAWEGYARMQGSEGIYTLTGMGTPLAPFVLQAMAAGRRFADARMGDFLQVMVPSRHEQFAAVRCSLGDGTTYVAFRGTDASLDGWREDFALSYEVVAAQRDALAYLCRVARGMRGRLRVGGHSKGGNLAAFAAAFSPDAVRDRVAEVWCNDSPGFDRQVVDFTRLEAIAGRTRLFSPEYSVVGALMEHVVEPVRVASADKGIGQHSMMGWQVDGCQLTPGGGLDPEAARVDVLFSQLVQSRDLAGRRAFVDDVFGALAATGATTTEEIFDLGPAAVETVVAHLGTRDPQTRGQVRDILLALGGQAVVSAVVEPFGLGRRRDADNKDAEPGVPVADGTTGEVSLEGMQRHRARRERAKARRAPVATIKAILRSEVLRSTATLVVGVLILANATENTPVLGYAMVVAAGVYAVFLLGRYVRARRAGGEADSEDLAIGILTVVPVLAVVFLKVAVSLLYNLVLGGALLVWGIKLARQEHVRGAREFVAALRHARMLDGLLAIVLGVLLLVNPTQIAAWSQLLAGAYVTWHGVWGLITR